MKAVVNRAFIDNETQTGYNEGSIYENDNEERFIYLQDKKFLGATIKEKKKPPKDKNKPGDKEVNEENNNGDVVNQENPSDDNQGESQNE